MVCGFESRPAHQQHETRESRHHGRQVETLDKLERRITLTLAADTINNEVESRLKRWRAPSRPTASARARCR
jgi:hypothetical protein